TRQGFRQRGRAVPRTFEVGRRLVGFEVTPALEGTPRTGLDRHHLGFKNEMALADTLLVDVGTHTDQTLATKYFPTNDPIKRTPVDQFGGAFWHHACP